MKSGQQVELIERKERKALEMRRWCRGFLEMLFFPQDGAIKSLGKEKRREGGS